MNAKEFFAELRLLIRDIGVLANAMPLKAGDFEEVEEDTPDEPADTDEDRKPPHIAGLS